MNRRDLVKALGVAIPAALVTGPSGVAALTGAVIGTAITRPPRIRRLVAGDVVTAEWMRELVDAVNNANGFREDTPR